MKRIALTLFACIAASLAAFCQSPSDVLVQPTDILARRIDNSGEITAELASSFSYYDDGKLQQYRFPEHGLITTYSYADDFLTLEYSSYSAGHPQHYESYGYSYENGRLKTKDHRFYDEMETDKFWTYDYDALGRKKQIDYADDGPGTYFYHWSFEYEDNGRTKIETYYTSYESQGVVVRKITTYRYDEAFALLSKQTESFNASGESTGTTLDTYSYTPTGKTDQVVHQSLSDNGTWTNSSIKRYIRDENDNVLEYQTGSWSEDDNDWDINKKTVYNLDLEDMKLTVSFYRKTDGMWVWDEFSGQPVFYESALSKQQEALNSFTYGLFSSSEHVNQFEISLTLTQSPVYLTAKEHGAQPFAIFPNPASDRISLTFSPDVTPTRVELRDLQGRLLLSQESGFESVALGNLPAGVYTLHVTLSNGTSYSDKVVKR